MLILKIVALAGVALGQAERPPKLDFKQKIDYASWITAQASKGKKSNALPRYAPLLPKPDGTGGVPSYDEAVQSAISGYQGIWTPSEFPELAEYINKNSAYLAALEEATQIRDCWDLIPPGTVMLDYKMPIFSCVRNAGRARLARAWMKQDQQAKAIQEAHRVHLRAARHMKQHSVQIAHLVAIALRSEVYRSIRRAAAADIIPEEEYASWYSATVDDDPGAPAWDSVVVIEFAHSYSSMQSVCPGGKHDIKAWKRLQELFKEVRPFSDEDVEDATSRDPRDAVKALEDYQDALIAAGRGPYRYSNAIRIGVAWFELETITGNAFARLFAADLTRCYQLIARAEADRRGTMLLLAIRAHRAKHGSWPSDLTRIDAGIELKKLKTFLIDPISGKRFVYKLESGKPVLYSVGIDGDDDGGKHHPKFGENDEGGDYVFWPVAKQR